MKIRRPRHLKEDLALAFVAMLAIAIVMVL
jgi:hypothetical protein